ncbi:MAG: PaaI family thioesterase [Haloarculaceae archaeon]
MSDDDVRRAPADEIAFHEWLGLETVEKRDGRAVVEIPYSEEITNPFGVPHGGIVATAADVASGAALLSELDEGAYVTTTDLDVKFLEPAGGDLRATAEVVRIGGSMGVVRIEVTSETPEGDPATVSLAHATYRVYPDAGLTGA